MRGAADTPRSYSVVIARTPGWQIVDVKELWAYRDLLFHLAWRDIKVRYAQSVLGVGWAVGRPLAQMVIFTVVFGSLLKVGSPGGNYALFSYVALVPWSYFSAVLNDATSSLVRNRNMLTKVYFPRMIMPFASILGGAVDFVLSMLLLVVLMVLFRVTPSPAIVVLPLLILILVATVVGLGLLLGALAVQYRDVQYGLTFAIQLLMYLSPVVYSTSSIPQRFLWLYSLNPLVGVIEGSRAAFLGQPAVPWGFIAMGATVSAVLLILGAVYFRHTEKTFADVV